MRVSCSETSDLSPHFTESSLNNMKARANTFAQPRTDRRTLTCHFSRHLSTHSRHCHFCVRNFHTHAEFCISFIIGVYLKPRSLHFATRVCSVRACMFIMSPKGGVRKRIAEAQAARDVVEGQGSSSSHRSGGIRRRVAGSGAGSTAKNPLIDTLELKLGKGKVSAKDVEEREPASCRHCRFQRIRRTSNGLSKPHLGLLAAPRGSRGRTFLPHLATGIIHCSVLMTGSDRCSVRGRACGNLRSEATLEQPNGTGMNCKSRKFCGTIRNCLLKTKDGSFHAACTAMLDSSPATTVSWSSASTR